MLEVAVTPQGCLTMPLNEQRARSKEVFSSVGEITCRGNSGDLARSISRTRHAMRRRNMIDIRAATTKYPEDLAIIHAYINLNGGFDAIECNIKSALAAAGRVT